MIINVEEINIVEKNERFNWKIIFCKIINKIIENNNKEEAKAWIKKYFKDASVDIKLFVLIIKGINDKRLISNPIQALNHEFEEMVIIDPKIIVKKKIIVEEFFVIKKKRLFFIVRVWT